MQTALSTWERINTVQTQYKQMATGTGTKNWFSLKACKAPCEIRVPAKSQASVMPTAHLEMGTLEALESGKQA